MKNAVLFFALSTFCFSAPWDPPDATELKVRQTWADYYKKKGYDFDIHKMSASEMEAAFKKAEMQKKSAKFEKAESAKLAQAAEQRRTIYLKERDEIFKKEGVLLSPQEIELRKLEAEANRLYDIYLKSSNEVNHSRWQIAYRKVLDLKWELYPSLRPSGSSRSKLEDVEAKLEEISEKLDQK